jgi:hypothetical protein
MSVNNNAGLPVFEVFSDDRVVAGRFGQNDFVMTSGGNVAIGTGVPSTKFHVVGSSTFGGDVTTTGSFIAPSGSAALPSYEFVSDSDTGAFSPAANTFGVSTSGVERLRINNIGNVGIGLDNPVEKLDVLGNVKIAGANISLTIAQDDTTTMRMRSAGNLIVGAGSAANVRFLISTTEHARLSDQGRFGIGLVAPSGKLGVAGGATIGSNYNVTPPTNGLIVEGNVGIGTTTPTSQLHVIGTGNFTQGLQVNGTGVSISGHSHTTSDITNFGSAVSGLLPTVDNSGDNRVLTSTGSTLGINAESNLTFDGSLLTVTGSGLFNSGIIASNIRVTGNMISVTNSNGNLIIKPNASGALQADDAGNSRGIFSVDLQRSRLSVSGVANGDYSVIGGGSNNNAMGPLCTIGGGSNNTAGGDYYPGNASTIGGGDNNIAVGEKSTVGGGSSNSAGGNYSIVGGGQSNSAGGMHSIVGGGYSNSAIANKSTISGGTGNSSSGEYSIVGGGRSNSAAGYISAVCGGNSNSASGSHSTVGGGNTNSAGGNYSAVGGGKTNSIYSGSNYSTIAGGLYNYTGSTYSIYYGLYAFVGGGYHNTIYSSYSTIGGGQQNTIGTNGYTDSYSLSCVIGGGSTNSCDGPASTVGGGFSNSASGYRCTIAGGNNNSASSYESTIGGGLDNASTGSHSTVAGGRGNSATATGSTVGGGRYNTASGNTDSVVCGGGANLASGPGSTIAGGLNNTASGYGSVVIGGINALASSRGEVSHATGKFAADGDAQHSIFILRTKTTNNTATEMGLDGASVRLTIDSGQILSGTINIIGSRSDGSAVARYLRQFTIKNVGGTTSLVGSIITLGTDEAAGTSISITANNTNDFLSIQVTGIISQTWRWLAVVDCIKTKYGT